MAPTTLSSLQVLVALGLGVALGILPYAVGMVFFLGAVVVTPVVMSASLIMTGVFFARLAPSNWWAVALLGAFVSSTTYAGLMVLLSTLNGAWPQAEELSRGALMFGAAFAFSLGWMSLGAVLARRK
jgi:hypothetical protein